MRACSRCGTIADGEGDELPLGWSLSSSDRGVEWVCATCTREHVRSIESKLPEEWW